MKNAYVAICLILLLVSCSKEQLPVINIIKESEIGWDEKEPCEIIYTDGKKEEFFTAGIKCRGGSSSKYFKHSYRVELDGKFGFGGMHADDDWILNANYIDKTFMRHKISYDLFRQMNDKNVASHITFVNVAHNGIYHGLYVLMEKINASMVGLDKNDTLAMLFKDPPVFYEERLDYVQDSTNYYHQKYPKIHHVDKSYYIEQLRDFLFHSSDEEFANQISEWFDIGNVIDWHLLLLFTNNSDGIMKNFYLYKVDADTPFRFAIWDYDHAYGRDGDGELNMMENELDCNRSVLFKRLSNIEETGYTAKLKKRWLELREMDIISKTNFTRLVGQNDHLIAKEVEKNFNKWPADAKWYYDDNGYKEEIDIMSQFVDMRIEQLDERFDYYPN